MSQDWCNEVGSVDLDREESRPKLIVDFLIQTQVEYSSEPNKTISCIFRKFIVVLWLDGIIIKNDDINEES